MKRLRVPSVWLLDDDPELCAEYQTDKTLKTGLTILYYILLYAYFSSNGITSVKLITWLLAKENKSASDMTESRDILYKCFGNYFDNFHRLTASKFKKTGLYKWASMSVANWNYSLRLFEAFNDEYFKRYRKMHPFNRHLEFFNYTPPNLPFKEEKDNFPISDIPIRYRKDLVIESHRNYFMSKIVDPHLAYERTSIPEWIELKI